MNAQTKIIWMGEEFEVISKKSDGSVSARLVDCPWQIYGFTTKQIGESKIG